MNTFKNTILSLAAICLSAILFLLVAPLVIAISVFVFLIAFSLKALLKVQQARRRNAIPCG